VRKGVILNTQKEGCFIWMFAAGAIAIICMVFNIHYFGIPFFFIFVILGLLSFWKDHCEDLYHGVDQIKISTIPNNSNNPYSDNSKHKAFTEEFDHYYYKAVELKKKGLLDDALSHFYQAVEVRKKYGYYRGKESYPWQIHEIETILGKKGKAIHPHIINSSIKPANVKLIQNHAGNKLTDKEHKRFVEEFDFHYYQAVDLMKRGQLEQALQKFYDAVNVRKKYGRYYGKESIPWQVNELLRRIEHDS
jgi:tetratricopeptide (TPR) repeat protein